MFRRPILLILPILTLSDVDSYGAPSGPVYSPTPQSQYSAPATTYQATNAQLPNYDYYKHEHHHYYHAGPPKVVHVKVPVTQKPYVVQVPQNVPVQFVGVNVPTPAPPRVQVVQVQPQTGYSQPQHIHHYPVNNECSDFDLDCLGKAGKDLIGEGAQIVGKHRNFHKMSQQILSLIKKLNQSWMESYSRNYQL